MKVCVVVPGKEHFNTAGVRIRYQRIANRLALVGHELGLTVIDDIRLRDDALADVYLICKVHDVRAIVLAAELRARGVHVGVDFFDDYYSQRDDSRFVHIREWLKALTPHLTYTLCSTPLMEEALSRLLPQLPCLMLNDPYETVGTETLGSIIEHKVERARSSGILTVGWFGIGDNPHFPVGLSDLCNFGSMLAEMRAPGLVPRLSILTNRRAMTPQRLEMLRRLPIPYRIEEWSEAGESQLVAESYVCFLPVNAQSFSTVKSLNRAVTALTGGAQVLSAGFPLYESLGDFIYRDSANLMADLAAGTPRLRAETISTLLESLKQHADPAVEAGRLVAFLENLPPAGEAEKETLYAVMHGRQSTTLVHKFVQRLGHLSVAGPWSTTPLNHDIHVEIRPGEAVAMLSEKTVQRLPPRLASLVRQGIDHKGRATNELVLDSLLPRDTRPKNTYRLDHDSVFLSGYGEQLEYIERVLEALFGETKVLVSETVSPFLRRIPFRAPPAAWALESA